EKPMDVCSPADVGVDAAQVAASAGARRRRLGTPDRGAGAEMIDGSAADVAARIATLVRERVG
ncbi:MAG: electron transfer flavoprotein subunit beta, partial [Solirubrobacteraceae bacterium]